MSAPFIIRDEAGRKRAMDFLAKLNLAKPWQMTIAPPRKKRSLDQNSLYHKWCSIVAAETGNSHNAVHEWAKDEFLPPVFIEIGGRRKEIRRSTTELNTAEMSAYMDRFNAWAESDLGIMLPHPDDLGRAA
jgi:hypothetical protein